MVAYLFQYPSRDLSKSTWKAQLSQYTHCFKTKADPGLNYAKLTGSIEQFVFKKPAPTAPHPSMKRNHLPSQDKTNMRTFGFGSRGFPEAALCVEESIRSQSNSLKLIQYWLQTALLSDCKLSHACGSNCGIVCGTWQSVAHLLLPVPGVTVSQQCKTSCRLKRFQLVDLFVG